MAHEIEQKNGIASIVLQGQPAWHSLGDVLQGIMTSDDIRDRGFFNYSIEVRPLFSSLPDGSFDPVTFGIFRSDTGQFFSPCQKGYTPIQPIEILTVLDAIKDTLPETSSYDCAGVLQQGQKIFATIRIPDMDLELATGDNYLSYLCFVSSFDRTISPSLFSTKVRVVCNNTLNQGISNNIDMIKVKQTKNGKEKLDRIVDVFGQVVENNNDFKERMEFLANKELDKDTYLKIMNKIFPEKADKTKLENGLESAKKRNNSRRENTISEITDLFEMYNQDRRFPEYVMSPYNLLNAITDYTDHSRGVRKTEKRQDVDENVLRAESSIFGSGDSFKRQSMEIIMEMCGTCKDKPHATYMIPAERRTVESSKIYAEMAEKMPETSLLDSILDQQEY